MRHVRIKYQDICFEGKEPSYKTTDRRGRTPINRLHIKPPQLGSTLEEHKAYQTSAGANLSPWVQKDTLPGITLEARYNHYSPHHPTPHPINSTTSSINQEHNPPDSPHHYLPKKSLACPAPPRHVPQVIIHRSTSPPTRIAACLRKTSQPVYLLPFLPNSGRTLKQSVYLLPLPLLAEPNSHRTPFFLHFTSR